MVAKSFLETNSVSSSTQNTYTEAVNKFVTMCTLLRLDWSCDEELDAILVHALDRMFFEGQPAHTECALVAALRWFAPRYRR